MDRSKGDYLHRVQSRTVGWRPLALNLSAHHSSVLVFLCMLPSRRASRWTFSHSQRSFPVCNPWCILSHRRKMMLNHCAAISVLSPFGCKESHNPHPSINMSPCVCVVQICAGVVSSDTFPVNKLFASLGYTVTHLRIQERIALDCRSCSHSSF